MPTGRKGLTVSARLRLMTGDSGGQYAVRWFGAGSSAMVNPKAKKSCNVTAVQHKPISPDMLQDEQYESVIRGRDLAA
jgi:hypothetical protein